MIAEIWIWFNIFLFSFLLHELMHIKGQGLKSTGNISVHKLGMTVCATNNKYPKWFLYSGGILAGINMFILSLFSSGTYQKGFFVFGLVHFIYGLYEGLSDGKVKYRYYLYLIVFIIGIAIVYMM